MPNWCEGNVRFRGKQKDIKRFLMNEIVACKYCREDGEEGKNVVYKPTIEDEDYMLLIAKEDEHSWFWFKDTKRYFPEDEALEIWLDDSPDEETIVCIDNIRAAWSFEHCEQWIENAKKYGIDVKLTGYEKGMLFSQTKTIMRDGTVKDEIKEYCSWMDWMWNCPQPNNGG